MTEAIAEATPRPWLPYAKRQIGTPILPVFGRINGGSSILKSFLRKKRSKSPINMAMGKHMKIFS